MPGKLRRLKREIHEVERQLRRSREDNLSQKGALQIGEELPTENSYNPVTERIYEPFIGSSEFMALPLEHQKILRREFTAMYSGDIDPLREIYDDAVKAHVNQEHLHRATIEGIHRVSVNPLSPERLG